MGGHEHIDKRRAGGSIATGRRRVPPSACSSRDVDEERARMESWLDVLRAMSTCPADPAGERASAVCCDAQIGRAHV